MHMWITQPFRDIVNAENSSKFDIINFELCITGIHVTFHLSFQGPELRISQWEKFEEYVPINFASLGRLNSEA